jgi:exodeoxyribonuclease VII small subunit
LPKKAKEISFEEGLDRLREIVETLESGTPTLSETINLFEEGVTVARHLEALLADAETKVEKLTSAGPAAETVELEPEAGEGADEESKEELF